MIRAKSLIRKVIDIRDDEIGTSILMFFYFFAIIASYYILKPVRNSLFLEQLGAKNLPWVYIGTASIIGFVVLLYNNLSKYIDKKYLVSGTIIFFILNLILFRELFKLNVDWFAALFYVWVSIFSVLLISQFWMTANIIYSASQAKRLFGFIGSGGILGGITGGGITNSIATSIGTENLLLLSAGILIFIIFIANKLNSITSNSSVESIADTKSDERGTSAAKIILNSKHLQFIGIIISLNVIISSFIDYEFNTIIEKSFNSIDERTAFFGSFFASMNIASLLIQLFLTSFVLKRFGIGISMLILPLGLLLGSFGMFIYPVLLSAVLLKTTDGSLKYSLDNSTREIMYLPIPLDLKLKVKPLLDIFLQRFARGIAGLIIILGTTYFDLDIAEIAGISIIIILLWILSTFGLNKEYLNSLRELLRSRDILPEHALSATVDASTTQMLSEALKSRDNDTILYALKMLESTSIKSLVPTLKPLLTNNLSEIRQRSIKLLSKIGDSSLVPEIEKLLYDENYGVLADAIHYVCMYSGNDQEIQLKTYLNSPDIRVRSAAIVCMANSAPKEEIGKVQEFIEELLLDDSADQTLVRTELARSLAFVISPSPLHDNLMKLLQDEDSVVRIAAIKASKKILAENLVPYLIKNLADKKTLSHARNALAKYGKRIINSLSDTLSDESQNIDTRSAIARVLGKIPEEEAVKSLISNLKHDSPSLRYNIIKSLNKLHNRNPELKKDSDSLKTLLLKEVRYYYELLGVIVQNKEFGNKIQTNDLLFTTLQGRMEYSFERIFRILALLYDPNDIYQAYHAITQGEKILRANAYELLDNVLNSELKDVILQIVDNTSIKHKVEIGRKRFGIEKKSFVQLITDLYKEPDIWLKIAVLHTIGANKINELKPLAENGLLSENSVVRETAEYSLNLLKSSLRRF